MKIISRYVVNRKTRRTLISVTTIVPFFSARPAKSLKTGYGRKRVRGLFYTSKKRPVDVKNFRRFVIIFPLKKDIPLEIDAGKLDGCLTVFFTNRLSKNIVSIRSSVHQRLNISLTRNIRN